MAVQNDQSIEASRLSGGIRVPDCHGKRFRPNHEIYKLTIRIGSLGIIEMTHAAFMTLISDKKVIWSTKTDNQFGHSKILWTNKPKQKPYKNNQQNNFWRPLFYKKRARIHDGICVVLDSPKKHEKHVKKYIYFTNKHLPILIYEHNCIISDTNIVTKQYDLPFIISFVIWHVHTAMYLEERKVALRLCRHKAYWYHCLY